MRVNIIKLKTFFLILLENALQMRASNYNRKCKCSQTESKRRLTFMTKEEFLLRKQELADKLFDLARGFEEIIMKKLIT